MIQINTSLPAQGMTLRTVSFQGTQLSESQRRNLALQQQVKAPFMNAVLTEQFEKNNGCP